MLESVLLAVLRALAKRGPAPAVIVIQVVHRQYDFCWGPQGWGSPGWDEDLEEGSVLGGVVCPFCGQENLVGPVWPEACAVCPGSDCGAWYWVGSPTELGEDIGAFFDKCGGGDIAALIAGLRKEGKLREAVLPAEEETPFEALRLRVYFLAAGAVEGGAGVGGGATEEMEK